jgi:hypothetical protein
MAQNVYAFAACHLLNPPIGTGCAVVRNAIGEYTVTLPVPRADDTTIFTGWVEDPGGPIQTSISASKLSATQWFIRIIKGGAPTDDHGHITFLTVDDKADGLPPLGH